MTLYDSILFYTIYIITKINKMENNLHRDVSILTISREDRCLSRFIRKKNQTRRIHTTIRHDYLTELGSHKKIEMRCFRVRVTKKKGVFVLYEIGNNV